MPESLPSDGKGSSTLAEQQIIPQQADVINTARLGIVGPRDHGNLLQGKKKHNPELHTMSNPKLGCHTFQRKTDP